MQLRGFLRGRREHGRPDEGVNLFRNFRKLFVDPAHFVHHDPVRNASPENESRNHLGRFDEFHAVASLGQKPLKTEKNK